MSKNQARASSGKRPASAMTRHHYSFPVVTGIDPGDPLASRKARMAVYGRLIGELDSNGQRLSEQISEIDLTDPEDVETIIARAEEALSATRN